MILDFVDHRLAGVLISFLVLGDVHASDKWLQVNNTHGWSLSYPASWEAYVMQAPDSGPELSIQESDNVNFDGPKDCYENKERCGLFQISLDSVKANRHFDSRNTSMVRRRIRASSQKKPANSMECRSTSLNCPKINV